MGFKRGLPNCCCFHRALELHQQACMIESSHDLLACVVDRLTEFSGGTETYADLPLISESYGIDQIIWDDNCDSISAGSNSKNKQSPRISRIDQW